MYSFKYLLSLNNLSINALSDISPLINLKLDSSVAINPETNNGAYVLAKNQQEYYKARSVFFLSHLP